MSKWKHKSNEIYFEKNTYFIEENKLFYHQSNIL